MTEKRKMGNYLRPESTTDDSEPYRNGARQQSRLRRHTTRLNFPRMNSNAKLNVVETNESPQVKDLVYEKLVIVKF